MNTSTLVQKVWNFCNPLRAAFAGRPVPQDPNEELVSALLARIRAERAEREVAKNSRGRKIKETTT